jgi:uncharacterized lipoprotein YddW (UPF0748 family)
MTAASLVWLLGTIAFGAEQEIDRFDYRDTASACSAWKTSDGTPALEMVRDGDRSVLQVRAPFQTKAELSRVVIDRRVKLDLSSPGAFALEIQADHPEAIRQLSLYFHSGKGWHSASGSLTKPGWRTVRFLKTAFRTEDQPGGWDQVDTIRIAAWNGRPLDTPIRVRRLTAVSHEVAVVVPTRSGQLAGEAKAAQQMAQRFAVMLDDLRLGCDQVDEAALTRGDLGSRKVAILAHNPHLGDDAIAALETFVAAGGKLLVCYSLPTRLARLLDIKSSKYVRPERPGTFAEMRFDTQVVAGVPETAQQRSWNITAVEPDSPHARIVGRWYDDQGQPTNHAALVVGRHGAFLSHVLLTDDADHKRQLLAALLGHFNASLWQAMVQSEIEHSTRIGQFESVEQLGDFIKTNACPEARQLFDQGAAQLSAARQKGQTGNYVDAMADARQCRTALARAYALAQPSRNREGRAVWNHSGMGAYPGDWDRSAKELAAAGFNIILPNMLWGGLAHYESDILPRSNVFREHGDQIAQCVAAAKKHGLEVHVWKVNFNLSNAPKEFVERMRAENRLIVSASGETHTWLCPSHPANLKLELESMLEVARKYEVDGLHFDYIRYPGAEYCFCDGCRQRFEKESGRPVANWPKDCKSGDRREEYQDFRCRQITRLVEAVHREAKQLRPTLKISAAVFRSYPGCRCDVGQDWVAWVKAGYLDFLCPMDYTPSRETFQSMVENQLRLVEGKIPLYPGIGATATNISLSHDEVLAQVNEARRQGAAGFTIFNFSEKTAQSIIPAIGLGAGKQRATPPHK